AAGHRRHPVHLLRRPGRRPARSGVVDRAGLRPRPEAFHARSGLRSGPAVPVAVSNLQRRSRVSAGRLRAVTRRALAALGRADREVHVTVVDDRRIRALNARYLGSRRATDVLAFDLAGPRPGPRWGEGVVSGAAAPRPGP